MHRRFLGKDKCRVKSFGYLDFRERECEEKEKKNKRKKIRFCYFEQDRNGVVSGQRICITLSGSTQDPRQPTLFHLFTKLPLWYFILFCNLKTSKKNPKKEK